jgi:hypothetical protein
MRGARVWGGLGLVCIGSGDLLGGGNSTATSGDGDQWRRRRQRAACAVLGLGLGYFSKKTWFEWIYVRNWKISAGLITRASTWASTWAS